MARKDDKLKQMAMRAAQSVGTRVQQETKTRTGNGGGASRSSQSGQAASSTQGTKKKQEQKPNNSRQKTTRQSAGGNSSTKNLLSSAAQKGAAKAAQAISGSPRGAQAERVERAMQGVLNRDRFARDVLARQAVRSDNVERNNPSVLPNVPFVRNRFNPRALASDRDWQQLLADYDINERLAGRRQERATHKDVIDTTALDPLSALKADATSRAFYGRNVGMRSKELTDEEAARKDAEERARQTRNEAAKEQRLSKHDKSLPDQIQELIQRAKQDFDDAAARGDRNGMQTAHRKAEAWRRIYGGYSGGRAGSEYITPEISDADRAILTEEGLRRLSAAKLGWQNAWNDTDRARYAQMGADIRKNPAYRKNIQPYAEDAHGRRGLYMGTQEEREREQERGQAAAFDRGAYREEDAHGRRRYAGTQEEREREAEQMAAIPKAIGTGIAGSFASIPTTTVRALQQIASEDQARLQNISDIRGGGEVNIPAPGEIDPDSLGQRLLRKSDEYREKATEWQTGLERYLTEALITGGEMIPGLAATALSGGAAAPGLALMGAQAAGRKSGTLEAQGVDPKQAFMRGLISGGIEAGTELIPLRNLAKIAKGGGDSFAKNMLMQTLEEIGTEEASEILQYGADKAFKDPNASLTAQDLKDTAVISALVSLGLGTGAGMLGSRRNLAQRQRETAAQDQVTPTDEELTQRAQDLQARVSLWHERGARLQARLAESTTDLTWHKHLLAEMERHEAEREQLKQKLVGLEMQKFQRAQVEQQKNEQRQETEDIQNAVGEAMQTITERQSVLPPSETAQEPQPEAAESPVLRPEQARDGIMQGEAQAGTEAQETAHNVSRDLGAPENHIDNRDSKRLGDRNIKAFQWDHPEVKPYFQDAAKALLADAQYSDASRMTVRASKRDIRLGRKAGTIMQRNEPLNMLHDMGLSTPEIMKACEAIIHDQGQENYAAAKRVELALDYMLSNGYAPLESGGSPSATVRPSEEYLTLKAEINGGTARGSWEEYRKAHEFILELGEVSEEELRAEWEARQSQAQEQRQPVFQSMEDELADLYDRLYAFLDESEAGTHDQSYYDEQAARFLAEERAIRAKWEEETMPQDEEIVVEEPYSVGAAPGGFDPTSEWQLGTDQFHPINERAIEAEAENWGRAPVDIPIRDPYGQLTSKTASTLINAGMTPDQISRGLAEMARNGQLSRIPYTDDAATAEAERIINEQGYQRAKESWLSDIHAGKMSKDITVMGIILYNNAANSGHIVEAMDLATEMIEYGKTAGQVLQAVNIINKLGPTGKLYSLASSLEKLENKIRQNKKWDAEHWDGITIPKDLGKAYIEAQTEEEQRAIETEIKKAVAQQIPNTLGDKLDAWRYTAMLGNPLTQERNFVGNVGFQPVRIAKNMIGAGLERMMGLDPSERTKSLQFKAFSKADKARYQAGLDEYDQVESVIMGNGKYNDTFSDIDQYRRIFKNRFLEGWRKLTNAGLEAGDMFFAKRTYADSLAGVLKARGITAEQYNDPSFSKKQKEEIQAIAIVEAQKATYRDINKFSSWVSGLGKGPNTPKAIHYLTEGLLPFKKTPANVLMRGIEYSPIGLIKGIADMNTKVKRGEMTAAEGLDEIASGLTGTGLLGLGVALGISGIVSAGADDDEKQSKFDDLIGKQSYSLNLPGGYSYSLNWLAPEAIPFFMGVELQKAWQDVLTGEKGKDALWNALRRISDPVLEMSMLQGVNDLIENVSYSDNKAMSILATLATGYLSQFISTIGGQIERTIEDRRYSTWIDRDSAVPSEIQYLIGKNLNKIPGIEYHQREYLNAWGEPEMTGNLLTRALKNFASPGYIKKESSGAVRDVEDELQRLYNEGFNVFPTIEKTSTKINGEQVTAEQFNLLQGTKGQLMKDLYSQTINTQEYKDLPDADKAKVLERLKDYAQDMGQVAAGRPRDTLDNWAKNADDLSKTTGIGVAALIEASGMAQAINADKEETALNKALRFYDYMDKKGYTEEQQTAVRDAYFTSNEETRGLLETIKSGTVSKETVERFIEEGRKFDTNENGLDQDEKIATLKSMGLSHEESKALFEAGAARNEDGTAKTTYESKLESVRKAEEKKARFKAVPADVLPLFETAAKTHNQGSANWSYDDLYYTAMAVDTTDANREAWYNAQKPANYDKTWQQVKKMPHKPR